MSDTETSKDTESTENTHSTDHKDNISNVPTNTAEGETTDTGTTSNTDTDRTVATNDTDTTPNTDADTTAATNDTDTTPNADTDTTAATEDVETTTTTVSHNVPTHETNSKSHVEAVPATSSAHVVSQPSSATAPPLPPVGSSQEQVHIKKISHLEQQIREVKAHAQSLQNQLLKKITQIDGFKQSIASAQREESYFKQERDAAVKARERCESDLRAYLLVVERKTNLAEVAKRKAAKAEALVGPCRQSCCCFSFGTVVLCYTTI